MDPDHTGQPVQVTGGPWGASFVRFLRSDFEQGVVIDRILTMDAPMDRRIDISAATIEHRTVDAPPPPPQQEPNGA